MAAAPRIKEGPGRVFNASIVFTEGTAACRQNHCESVDENYNYDHRNTVHQHLYRSCAGRLVSAPTLVSFYMSLSVNSINLNVPESEHIRLYPSSDRTANDQYAIFSDGSLKFSTIIGKISHQSLNHSVSLAKFQIMVAVPTHRCLRR